MAGQNLIRVAALALCLSTLSFAVGVAGDLTVMEQPRSGQRVVLRIPPELPTDAVRAAPLPPLISTAAAREARPRLQRVAARYDGAAIFVDEPQTEVAKPQPRLEVQLAHVTPKAASAPAPVKHERKAA